MKPTKEEFINEILTKTPDLLASIWLIDRTPIIFDCDVEKFAQWRISLGKGLNVDPSALIITGSGAFGISLNPNKKFKEFDADSDVDVAVISEHHFNIAWRFLRGLGSERYRFSPVVKQSIIDHVNKYIYWGTIATDKLLPILPFGREWRDAIEIMRKDSPILGRTLNARIYKDLDSLRAYQVHNLINLRNYEFEKGIPDVKIFEYNK